MNTLSSWLNPSCDFIVLVVRVSIVAFQGVNMFLLLVLTSCTENFACLMGVIATLPDVQVHFARPRVQALAVCLGWEHFHLLYVEFVTTRPAVLPFLALGSEHSFLTHGADTPIQALLARLWFQAILLAPSCEHPMVSWC